eukprot:416262_1
MTNITVICSAIDSCVGMNINATDFDVFNLYCVESGSCQDVNVNLVPIDDRNHGNGNDGIINCISANSCDNLEIITTSNKTQLIMYEYSENIIFDNSIGYLTEEQNIICNNDRYIRYAASINQTEESVLNLILNEYDQRVQQLPCNDIEIICGNVSCSMKYSIKSPQFQVLKDDKTFGCWWVNIQELQQLICDGECESSPTESPSYSPSYSPTPQTVDPTTAPSSAPSVTPSIAPSAAPSLSPTTTPIIAPTLAPSITPTTVPSISPTQNPSAVPSNIPTTSPSVSPTNAPSITPSVAPSITPTTIPTTSPSITPSNIPTTSPSTAPSVSPTVSPSIIPTAAPSVSPTIAPSLTPSVTPTFSPTNNPSIAPTLAPTMAPTRYPTFNVDDIYDAKIDITYVINNLTLQNIEILEDYTVTTMP